METICARLCLLTRAAWKSGLPAPLTRPMVRRMLQLGALSGLALRRLPEIKDAYYERAEALLSRSAEIYDAVESWRAQGYDIMLPEDEDWPNNLQVLGTQMPQFLFVKGNRALLARGCVAAAGSRRIKKDTVYLAGRCGQALAKEGYTLVCGGARGADTAVQRAFLSCGGSMILVPALPVETLLRQVCLANALADGRLLIVCDTWPDEPFSAKKALSRNHTIYALGNAALVVASREGKGGTWNGASACLRGGYTPLYATVGEGTDLAGNRMLIARGAKPFDPEQLVGMQMFALQEDGYR